MAKQQVPPWKNFFKNGTLLFVPLTPAEHTDHHNPASLLEAFLTPESEEKTDPATARGAYCVVNSEASPHFFVTDLLAITATKDAWSGI
jgi:hypothetical protein